MTTVTLNTITRKVEVFSSARDVQARAYGHDSKPSLEAVNVPPGIDHVFLRGYSAAGDGGAAHYKRVASEPGHPGKIQSNDGAWWEVDETRLNVKMFGTGTAAFQAAIDVLPNAGGRVIVPVGDYSLVDPALLDFSTTDPNIAVKKVVWDAHGATLPGLPLPGEVSAGDSTISARYLLAEEGSTGRQSKTWHWHDIGEHKLVDVETQQDNIIHVQGTLADDASTKLRELRGYSFAIVSKHAAGPAGVRGIRGSVIAEGASTKIRAIRVVAEGRGAHDGVITGIMALATRSGQPSGAVSSAYGESAVFVGQCGPGIRTIFEASGNDAKEYPQFGFRVRTGSNAAMPSQACFAGHGGGGGDLLRGYRDEMSGEIVVSVDNKARIMARSFYSGRRTLAADTAIAVAHPNASGDAGFFRFWVVTDAARFGEAFYRTTSGAVMTQIFTGGTDIVFTIGVLTGTTGTSGKLTVSAHTDGNIYIENRLAGTKTIAWAFIATALETGQLT